MSFNPVYKATPDTLLEGQRTTGSVDDTGALRVAVNAIGSPDDAAWNGTDPEATLISIMKACYAVLVDIETNTST